MTLEGSAPGDRRLRLKFADQANFSLGSVDQTHLTPCYPTTKSIALDQTVEVKYCSDPGVVGRGPMGSQTAQWQCGPFRICICIRNLYLCLHLYLYLCICI